MHRLQKRRFLIPVLAILFLALMACCAAAEGGQISGAVYYDRNNNGVMDEKEAAIPNAKVFLEQRGEDGSVKELAGKTISREGDFAFAVNQAGEYRLRVELPRDYYFTLHGEGSRALPAQNNKSATPFFHMADGGIETVNIGGAKSLGILSLVAFVDNNANGGRASTEPFLRGVVGELFYEYEGETYPVAKVTSDKNGSMLLRDLSPATYTLKITLPENYVVGPKGEKINTWYNCINAGEEEGTGFSDPLVLEPNHTISMGVGAVKTGSLQGRLWFDENFNGRRDAEESGLADATVLLISPTLDLTRETRPDENGEYQFRGLQPGAYKLGVQLPDGLVFTYPEGSQIGTIGSYGETAAYVEAEKTTTVNDIGAMPAATLRLAFRVDQNLDGVLDGEQALQGVSVTVAQMGQTVETKVSGEDGSVSFSALRSGEAEVSCALPEGYIFEITEEGEIVQVQSAADSCSFSAVLGEEPLDAAVAVTLPAAIRGALFEDPQNTGWLTDECDFLSGFTVQAVAADGAVSAQAVTDTMGEYTLYPLHAGEYIVQFLLNDPYVASPHTDDNAILRQSPAFGETAAVALAPGQTVDQVNGAVFRAGVVDGYVFNALAAGRGGLRGITATLLNDQGEPVSDFSYGVTDEDGHFLIKGVLPGAYSVRYTLPESAALTDADEREFTSAAFTIVSGTEYRLPDVSGVYTASLSGFVGQGAKQPVSALITLTGQQTGAVYESFSSEETGEYSFTGLRPDTYTMRAALPEGYVFGQLEGSPFGPRAEEIDETVLTLQPEDQKTIDIRAALPVDFSGVAFYDANLSGEQDEKEAAAPERQLSLWMGDTKTADLTSDESGAFSARHLVPGAYTLRITLQENEIITGGSAEKRENEWILPLTLEEDAFLAVPVLRYATVTGTVWNLDGSENHVAGIEITLLDADGKTVGSIASGEDGAFGFSRLLPGRYTLSAALPDGYLFAKEQDTQSRASMIQTLDDGERRSLPFNVPMGKKVTGRDIGIGAIGRIGDKAWLDENGNGMQDIGEPGMPGIQIELYRNGELAASATTDLYGRYSLDNLYPGEYEMRVTMHKELKATKRQTTFPLVASILPESDKTTITVSGVVAPSGGENLHCDLGFQLRKSGTYPAVMKQIPTKDWTPYSERKNNP